MLNLIFNFFLILSLIFIDFKGLFIISNFYQQFFNYNYLNLFIITHKDFKNYINNKYYKILCDDFTQLQNKYDINIITTKKNNELYEKKIGYSEGSKIYYIFKEYKKKTMNSKYIGFNHYRRIFSFGNNIPNLDDIFKKYDVILKKHNKLRTSLKKQYYMKHDKDDIEDILDIIKDKFPKYYSTAKKTLNSKLFYICNIFIMKKEDFIKYGNFTFEILLEFDKRHNLTNDDDIKNFVSKKKKNKKFKINIQRRLEGFLMERISNIFYNFHFKNKYEITIKSNLFFVPNDLKKKYFIYLEKIIIFLIYFEIILLKKKKY